MAAYPPVVQLPELQLAVLPLWSLNPREVAQYIRSLDSRLVALDLDESESEPVLLYTFELLGKREMVRVALNSEPIDSIAEFYPEAAPRERELERQYGVRFRARPWRVLRRREQAGSGGAL